MEGWLGYAMSAGALVVSTGGLIYGIRRNARRDRVDDHAREIGNLKEQVGECIKAKASIEAQLDLVNRQYLEVLEKLAGRA